MTNELDNESASFSLAEKENSHPCYFLRPLRLSPLSNRCSDLWTSLGTDELCLFFTSLAVVHLTAQHDSLIARIDVARTFNVEIHLGTPQLRLIHRCSLSGQLFEPSNGRILSSPASSGLLAQSAE
jgi:hypothetical protein